MGVASDDSSSSGFSFPKNLTLWWSEETEYLLQRIERWAAYARGYNRLRSARLSPGRMTMQDEPESRWTINRATNRLVVEESWAPTFRQRRGERSRLNCCALDSYKSNGKLDSNCLEAYSLDHSIYFKTIGEIRNGTRSEKADTGENNNNNGSSNSANNNNNDAAAPRSVPLDCGDFLSSDFDELDDDEDMEELDEVDFELREQLEQLEASAEPTRDVIQVCRSVIDEDEINNNFTMLRLLPRRSAAAQ